MAKARRRRILIVEDDEILARALINVIRGGAEEARASTVAAAKRMLRREPWDGLVIDVGLPDGDGLELLAWAREAGVRTPALVITGQYEPALANRADLLNAQFAYKPEILPNVKAFLGRVRASAGEAETTARAVVSAEELGRHVGMTAREIELTRLVVEGVPRGALAERLRVSENTVKTRVRRLLDKAGLPNLEALARNVLEAVARDATTQSGEGPKFAAAPKRRARS